MHIHSVCLILVCDYVAIGNKLQPLICEALVRVSMKLVGNWEKKGGGEDLSAIRASGVVCRR